MDISYFTDGSIAWNTCCAGYIIHDNASGQSTSYVVRVSKNNIHLAELVAIKLALIDICNNYDPSNTYNIYTDSDTALRLIKKNDSRQFSEVEEINTILKDLNYAVNIYLIKSHIVNSPKDQIRYFQNNNGIKLNYSKARHINAGNELVDAVVRSGTRFNDAPIYVSTPFVIRL